MTKRALLATLAALPFAARSAGSYDADAALRRKFRSIAGVVVVLDVAKGSAEKRYVTLTSDAGRHIAAPSRMMHGGRDNLSFTGGDLPVPKTVHVTWREGKVRWEPQGWFDGQLVGDYNVHVASRIPDEVLDFIRAGRRRALRLKFRLKDDGVLFGWDVEETFTTQFGTGLRYLLPGGDFLDTHY